MESLARFLVRVFDQAIFTDYAYVWITLLIGIIVFSPIGKNIGKFLKAIINSLIFIPALMALTITGHLVYYAHAYGNPVGFILGVAFLIFSGFLFNKFKNRKIIS